MLSRSRTSDFPGFEDKSLFRTHTTTSPRSSSTDINMAVDKLGKENSTAETAAVMQESSDRAERELSDELEP